MKLEAKKKMKELERICEKEKEMKERDLDFNWEERVWPLGILFAVLENGDGDGGGGNGGSVSA